MHLSRILFQLIKTAVYRGGTNCRHDDGVSRRNLRKQRDFHIYLTEGMQAPISTSPPSSRRFLKITLVAREERKRREGGREAIASTHGGDDASYVPSLPMVPSSWAPPRKTSEEEETRMECAKTTPAPPPPTDRRRRPESPTTSSEGATSTSTFCIRCRRLRCC